MILRVEACWARISIQLDVSKQLERSMTAEQKDIQHRLFASLQSKLEAASQKLSTIEQPRGIGKTRRLKLALIRDSLEDTISEIESWQKICEPVWFYWVKLAAPVVDMTLHNLVKTAASTTSGSKRLGEAAMNFRRAFTEPTEASQSVFIREDALDGYTTTNIAFNSAKVAAHPRHSQRLIMDVVDLLPNTPAQTKNVRDFARRLRQSDHSISGLLSCKGVVRHSDNMRLSLLFCIPEGYTDVWNLRQLLLSGRAHDSLSDRLEMAKQLAKVVYYVHLYGFVHKSIWPETILSLGKASENSLYSTVCLVGFQVLRTADGRTYSMSDLRWEKNLYRHPQRQGNEVDQRVDYFVMQHDIYSLGVCLLEIGLWESFVAYSPDGAAQPSPALGISQDRAELQDPSALKHHLLGLSRSARLRGKMGNRYGRVVETCLTCLDKDNVDFGDEEAFRDEDGVEVGTRYIEKVLGILNSVSA
ncbi:hypothetical protein GE09DRAFT_334561 [Coniochaeta sp. 2T2.1]|nr:hypothetical protein GE09DRAFT_334561 [Coniochaeta sp. 2T2.1]